MTDPREIDAFLTDLMPRLAALARDGFSRPGPVSFKSRGQPVTDTDRAVERAAREAIRAAFPDHAIVGEESGRTEGCSGTTWYIDPIDGTMNFARGIPVFCVSIGVGQGDRMVVGHVIDPMHGEHFRGLAGSGAFLGETRLSLGDARVLEHAILSTQTSDTMRFLEKPGFDVAIHRRVQKTRKLGSIALEMAYVAAGRIDLLIAGKAEPQPWWDIAGGWALIEAAGGVVVDDEGRPLATDSSHVVAGRRELVEAFLALYRDGG